MSGSSTKADKAEHRRKLWDAYDADPSHSNRNKLVEEYDYIAYIYANKQYKRCPDTFEMDDMLQEARIGLMQAIEKYDRSSGHTFNTFASFRVAGQIKDWLRKQGIIYVTRRGREKGIERKVASLETIVFDGENRDVDLGDWVFGDHDLEDVDRKEQVHVALKELSGADQLLLRLYYGEQMTMKEIGTILGFSESQISHKHKHLVKLLRSKLTATQPVV